MQPGAVIAERFEIVRLAGAGGMGEVYQARDLENGELVAVKLMRGADELTMRRLVREGRALAELAHPRIVRHKSHGVTAAGEPYLVLEWLEGEDLAARLRRGRLGVAETLGLARDVADALAAAHRRGIVHRDVKPANLFLARGEASATLLDVPPRAPRVKVLDFGIARVAGGEPRTGRAIGTPGYLAPEQARGDHEVDARADVFALGCVIFACLTGSSPFAGDDAQAALARLLFDDAPRLAAARPDVPAELDALVASMLARDAAARPADGAAVLVILEATPVLRGGAAAAVDAAVGPEEEPLVSLLLVDGGGPLRELLADGRVEVLGGERMAVTFAGADAALRAARYALAARQDAPRTAMALATARAARAGERAARLLGGPGIALDEVSAALLDRRFAVVREAGGAFLVAERDLASGARPLLGGRAPLVGRHRELAALRALCDEALEEGQARAALVIGGAGSGKSRLRVELLEAIAGFEVWVGQGDPQRSGSPLAVLADALRGPLGIAGDGDAAARRARLRARVAARVEAADVDRVSAFLGELVGAPFPDEGEAQLRAARRDPLLMGDQLRLAFEDWLAGELLLRPVLLVLDDLHWGDPPSIKLVDGALRNLADRPLVVIALARPEVLELFGGLWDERAVDKIHLRELSRASCARLVQQALGERATPELAARLAARSQGNPLYLEELVRNVFEYGAEAELPESVLAMVHARLDRLPAELRKVLRAASVFGDSFWEGGVAALLGRSGGDDVRPLLDELDGREWIAGRRDGRLPRQRERAFRHSLLREAAYATLTDEDRARAHAQAARWLEDAGEPDPVVLAEHHQRGGSVAAAIGCWTRAAWLALDGNDFEAAVARAGRAIELGAAGAARGEARLVQAEAYGWRAEHAAAESAAEEALALLPPGGDLWASAAHHAAWAYRVLGKSAALERHAASLREVFARGPSDALVIGMAATAMKLFEAGRHPLASALVDEIERATVDDDGGDPLVSAWVANAREYRAIMGSDPGEMLRSLRLSADHWKAAGDRRNAGLARINMGVALLELGALAEAERELREALALGLRLEVAPLVDGARQNLGWALAQAGRLDEARLEEERAAAAYAARGDGRYEGISQLYLARIALWAGDARAAEAKIGEALERIGGLPSWRAYGLAVQAAAALASGDAARAAPLAGEAMAVLESLGALEEGDAFVRLVDAETRAAVGRAAEAAAGIAAAVARLRERAARIADESLRTSFLERSPDNARTLQLAVTLG